MLEFCHRKNDLYCEDASVSQLAERYGTPLYIYSRKAFLDRLHNIKEAFAPAKPLICYSIKANSNLSILRRLARAGSGFDVVSGGELFRGLKAVASQYRQLHLEHRATLLAVTRSQPPPMVVYNTRRDGKTQPNPVARLLSGVEGLKQVFDVFNPVAIVAHRKHSRVTRCQNNFHVWFRYRFGRV